MHALQQESLIFHRVWPCCGAKIPTFSPHYTKNPKFCTRAREHPSSDAESPLFFHTFGPTAPKILGVFFHRILHSSDATFPTADPVVLHCPVVLLVVCLVGQYSYYMAQMAYLLPEASCNPDYWMVSEGLREQAPLTAPRHYSASGQSHQCAIDCPYPCPTSPVDLRETSLECLLVTLLSPLTLWSKR